MDVKKGTILYVKFAKLGIASKQEQNSHGFVKLYVKFLYLYEHDNQHVFLRLRFHFIPGSNGEYV